MPANVSEMLLTQRAFSAEVAALFEPSIEAAVQSIKAQIDASGGAVKVISQLALYQCASSRLNPELVRMARRRVRSKPMAVQPASRTPRPLQRHRQPTRQPDVCCPPARRSPDAHVPARSKAVADGAIGFYCDHHVSARMSKFMYGVEYLREFDPKDEEHVARKHRLFELPSGPKLLPDAFDCILNRVRARPPVWGATVLTRFGDARVCV